MTDAAEASILAVSAASVRPLRGEVLRPGHPPEQLVYPGDDDRATLHLAVVVGDGRIVGIVSTMEDGYPGSPHPGDWRIRGMATEPQVRNQGLGTRLLEGCEQHARRQGGARLWCNARTDARSLYERAGMTVAGEIFEIPGIGSHHLMCKPLD